MNKPITGQYECVHQSGVGLDYFTSRIGRLILQPSGRFTLIAQDRSRMANAAQSLIAGQQISTAAPETRREGYYSCQGNLLSLRFDDNTQQQGQFSWNGEGVQIEQNFFNKVSDSTLLPPTHRLKKDMDDIAKGLKIAGAIGGTVFKAAKTIHETIQSVQTTQPPVPNQGQQPVQGQNNAPPPVQPVPQPYQPQQPHHQVPPNQQNRQTPPVEQAQQAPVTAQSANNGMAALFCDRCGARVMPGKRFCNNCGARLG
jgi:hypothetical protein